MYQHNEKPPNSHQMRRAVRWFFIEIRVVPITDAKY